MSAHEWIPIGTSQISFRGTFDGGGHTISGLHVTGQEYAGLFGYVRGGEIRNVMLASDCQISGNTAGSIVGSIDEEGSDRELLLRSYCFGPYGRRTGRGLQWYAGSPVCIQWSGFEVSPREMVG